MSRPKFLYDGDCFLNDDGNLVVIKHDYDCTSPREWDNYGTFYTWMRGHCSPDAGRPDSIEQLSHRFGLTATTPKSFVRQFNKTCGVARLVYALDHTCITYKSANANPFYDKWDSGIAGVIFATNERILELYGGSEVTVKVRRKIHKALVWEVDEYNEWADGNCHGFVTYDKTGEQVDSCWGFIGDDVGGMEANCGGLHECEYDSLDEYIEAHENDTDVLETRYESKVNEVMQMLTEIGELEQRIASAQAAA